MSGQPSQSNPTDHCTIPCPTPTSSQVIVHLAHPARSSRVRKRRASLQSEQCTSDLIEEQEPRRSKRRRNDIGPLPNLQDVTPSSSRPPLPRAPKSTRKLKPTPRKPKPAYRGGSRNAAPNRRATSNPLPQTVAPLSASSGLDWFSQSLDEATFEFSLATTTPVETPLDPTEHLDVCISSIAPLPPPPPSISDTLLRRGSVGSVAVRPRPPAAKSIVVDITPTERETHCIEFSSSSPLLETLVFPSHDLGWIKVGGLVNDCETAHNLVSSPFAAADDLAD